MDNHTQRIAAVREAVQAQDSWIERYLSRPACEIIRPRLAADLEHLAEHEAAELGYEYHLQGIFGDGPRPEETQICEADALWYYRARTEEIARLLGLAQGGENA